MSSLLQSSKKLMSVKIRELIFCGFLEQVMQETTELKDRLDKERMELESRLRLQIDQQQQRASDLDRQVHNSIVHVKEFPCLWKLLSLIFAR